MLGYQEWTVKKNERGLLLRDGDFVRVLGAGRHWLWNPRKAFTVQSVPLEPAHFDHPLASYFWVQDTAWVDASFVRADVPNNQVGLLLQDGRLAELLAPGSQRLYWKGLHQIEVRTLRLEEVPAVEPALLREMKSANVGYAHAVVQAKVPEYSAGLLWLDGKVTSLLPAGTHGFWKFGRDLLVEVVDTRLQALEVSGQEILTRDKVSLRINLSATFKYLDVLQAWKTLQKPQEHLYRELQFALRAAVGTRTLDELLDDKTVIDRVVMQQVAAKFALHGIYLDSVGVKDIVLPGEMKTLLAQVVEAEKAAQTNVIRRCEETSATRSLLNTAKVLEDNPTALRLKELEALERVAERIDKITVFGGLDSVLNGMVKLR